jgi:hypothetical protein
MNDEEKSHYEEWKRKCAETKKRKSCERAETQSKIMKEKPGYRLITRGPNKGQLKWMGYKRQRIDRSSVAWAKSRKKEETRKLPETTPVVPPPSQREEPKSKEYVSPEVIWGFIFIYSVSIIPFFIAKMFAYLGIMGLALFIDAVCYLMKAKKTRYSRYLPFFWWMLSPKK